MTFFDFSCSKGRAKLVTAKGESDWSTDSGDVGRSGRHRSGDHDAGGSWLARACRGWRVLASSHRRALDTPGSAETTRVRRSRDDGLRREAWRGFTPDRF